MIKSMITSRQMRNDISDNWVAVIKRDSCHGDDKCSSR